MNKQYMEPGRSGYYVFLDFSQQQTTFLPAAVSDDLQVVSRETRGRPDCGRSNPRQNTKKVNYAAAFHTTPICQKATSWLAFFFPDYVKIV